ncbi:MAG: hypothetical protein MUC49_15860 [Raineya sp.]|jgi:hypothetical protein|nr:hypothetical protein [Raineya sp.]
MIFEQNGDCQKASINNYFDAAIIENTEDVSLEAFIIVKDAPNCVFFVGKVFGIPDAKQKIETFLKEKLFIIQ